MNAGLSWYHMLNLNYHSATCSQVGILFTNVPHWCLNFALHYHSIYFIGILPMVVWPHYPWHIGPPTHGMTNPILWYYEPPTHGISIPLLMVYWTLYQGNINTWHIEPPTHGMTKPFYGIMNPLLMEYRTPFQWYIKPPIKGISNAYPWNIKPPTHGILNPLLWYFAPLTNGISNPATMAYWTTMLGKNEGVQFTMMGFNIQCRKCAPGVKIPYGILNPGSIFQGFKIPYDTGLWWRSCCSITFLCNVL
jgi:hypothetical protein